MKTDVDNDKNIMLQKTYYTPRMPSSYAGSESVIREAKNYPMKRRDVKAWLEHQDTYTLYKPIRHKFQRNMICVSNIDAQWQADLIVLSDLAKENDGLKYILTVIDILSKYAWAVAIKAKTGIAVAKALETIFQTGRVPQKMQTDRGKEFLNGPVKKMFKKYSVHHFVTNNNVKAAIVERFNRTLKSKMWRYFHHRSSFRYIDVLQDMIHSYNHTYHRTIRIKPVDVTAKNALKVWRNVYGTYTNTKKIKPKLNIGDNVRIAKYKNPFRKGYEQTYTDEIFIVVEINTKGMKPLYKLKDYAEEHIEGSFYEEEVQKVPQDYQRLYRIEKILRNKTTKGKRYYYVKWLGYPQKFNSWISEKDLTDV